MGEEPGSKDKAMEALDFIINVLKEHELYLDKSIDSLADITDQIGEINSFKEKIDQLEGKVDNLQKDIGKLSDLIKKLVQ